MDKMDVIRILSEMLPEQRAQRKIPLRAIKTAVNAARNQFEFFNAWVKCS